MKKITLIITAALLFLMSGCASAPPNSPSEEIVMYSWRIKNENEDTANEKSEGSLDFDQDRINLLLKNADGSELKINEFFEIDDDSIIIVSEKLGTIDIKYKLNGNELELMLNNSPLYFSKCIN